MRDTRADKIFYQINGALLIIVTLIVAYPLYFVIIASFSDYTSVTTGKVIVWIDGFHLDAYKKVLENGDIWTGYRNTIFYTCFGTLLDLAVTLLAAYALSRKDLYGRGAFMAFFTFTMFFGGGMIPTYIAIRGMGLLNRPILLVILGSVNVYNLIVSRTFFQASIPDDLLEAAHIDGCGTARFFASIVLPLSKAIVAVMAVYFAVGHWNSYFSSLLYMSNRNYKSLQWFLREILNSSQQLLAMASDGQSVGMEDSAAMAAYAESIKYAMIIVSTLPMMCVYPIAQRYFIKGVMIGAIKG